MFREQNHLPDATKRSFLHELKHYGSLTYCGIIAWLLGSLVGLARKVILLAFYINKMIQKANPLTNYLIRTFDENGLVTFSTPLWAQEPT